MEDPEINPNSYTHAIFGKGTKNTYIRKKIPASTNDVGKTE
jgi:hypothetical protein